MSPKRDARIEAGPREGMVKVLAEFEALRAEVAKLARKVDQLAEVDAIMPGVDAPDRAREVAERRMAPRSRHVQAVK
jgi:hypothetical protein